MRGLFHTTKNDDVILRPTLKAKLNSFLRASAERKLFTQARLSLAEVEGSPIRFSLEFVLHYS